MTETDPAPAREHFARRAWDLWMRGEYEAAYLRARTGTRDYPEYATGWFVMARSLIGLGRKSEAVKSLERCLALEPGFPNAWRLLAHVHRQTGRSAAARAALLRLKEVSPESVLDTSDRDLTPAPASPPPQEAPPAAESGRKLVLVRKAPTEAIETPTLAEVYRRQGLLDRALAVYRRILERHPDDSGVRAMVHKLERELATRHKPAASA